MPGFPENIILVDDDPLILEFAKTALERVGDINVTPCGDYAQMKAAAKMVKPDLVLLDLRLPDKNGPDIVDEMRATEYMEDIPVIFITAEHKLTMQDEYKKLGILGVIHKPFTSSELMMTVQKLWQQYYFSKG